MGKKSGDKDAAADFFGDTDVSWMDDAERGSLPPTPVDDLGVPEKTGEQLPVAPPPPPPFDPSLRTATPALAPRSEVDDWARRTSDAPKDLSKLSQAPTLVFSSVPTLPPHPSPFVTEPVPVEGDHPADDPADGTGVERVAPPALADVVPPAPMYVAPGTEELVDAASDAETVEIDPRARQEDLTEIALPKEPTATESDAVYGDALGEADEPLVRTTDPAPARVQTPAPAPSREAFKLPAAPRRIRYAPRGGGEAWRHAAGTLVTAASYAPEGDRALLLFEAGTIHHLRLDDLTAAELLYREAVAAGLEDARLYRLLADLLGRQGRQEEQVQALRSLAACAGHAGRTDARIEAGLLLSRAMERTSDAVEILREVVNDDPVDYISRALLRALLPSLGASAPAEIARERMGVLEQLAQLAEAGIAADAWVERAILGEQLDASERNPRRSEEARRDLRRALDAERGHTIAFLRLERLLASDPVELARLYEAEAARDGQPEAGWWRFKAAGAHQAAGDGESAQAAYDAAIEQGYLFAERERQASWQRAGAHTELARSIEAEMAAAQGEARAFAAFRLGWARETLLGDAAGALEAYREAHRLDPRAGPAADGVSRLLAADPTSDDLAGFWRDRMAAAPEGERTHYQLRLAEIAETAADTAAATEGYRAVLASAAPGSTASHLAVAGLARVLERQADWAGLTALHEAQAHAQEDPRWRVHHLAAAAQAGPRTLPADAELRLQREILSLVPDEPAAVARVSMLFEARMAEGGAANAAPWRDLADLLKLAGTVSTDPHRRSALLYRAGRILVDRVADPSAARPCLEGALAADRSFAPARWLLREACGVAEPRAIGTMYRQQATEARDAAERAWLLVAAAHVGGPADPMGRQDLNQVLSARPDHPGALAAMELRCLVENDTEGLVKVYRGALSGVPDRSRALVALRVADLCAQQGRQGEARDVLADLAHWQVEGRPQRAAARLACTLGEWNLAAQLLEGLDHPEDVIERARFLTQAGAAQEAMAVYQRLLDGEVEPVTVGSRASTVAQRLGDREAMVKAYGAIARGAASPSLRAAYGAWTALQLEGMGKVAHALDDWSLALEVRPDSDAAFNGVTRGHVLLGSVEGLVECYARRPEARRDLADHLLACDAPGRARGVLVEELASLADASIGRRLPVAVLLERVSELAHEWQGVYDALTAVRELTEDPTLLQEIDAKRRWLLSEKLADTDAAWEQYRQLHDDAPNDREVTEALARIAGARGETALAIGYLRELADSAAGPDEAARYQRRIGEVYEGGGDVASAQQAYLDALDHVNDDAESLEGLKRLAERRGDWPQLVAVLQREANLCVDARRVDVLRRIAQVTEEHLGDPLVAIDAWRALLDLAPGDREALERLVALGEAHAEWGTFVECGDLLAPMLPLAEKTALWRRIGVVSQEQLDRDDALRFYELAVSVVPPDYEAAVRLEELFRHRADWPNAIRALHAQSQADVAVEKRVSALQKAARMEIEARHDRGAAAGFYTQILEILPTHEPSLRFMAAHLFEAGRFDEALPICERLEPMVENGQDLDDFDTRMELAAFYFYMAEMLRLQLDEEDAIPRYQRALELNPTHLPSLQAVGPLYVATEQWKRAEQVYRQLVQLSGGMGDRSKAADTYTALGLVERKLGAREKAQKRFNKALELHANHVGALKGMALVLEDQESWSNLLNIYNQIIYHATEPEDVKAAYMTKGRILDDHMQRQDKAAQHYQRSLDFDNQQPIAYARLAELAMRRDAYQEAAHLADQGVVIDPDIDDPDVRPLLKLIKACALKDAGHGNDAQRLLAEACSEEPALGTALGDSPLADLEIVRQVIKDRLP